MLFSWLTSFNAPTSDFIESNLMLLQNKLLLYIFDPAECEYVVPHHYECRIDIIASEYERSRLIQLQGLLFKGVTVGHVDFDVRCENQERSD